MSASCARIYRGTFARRTIFEEKLVLLSVIMETFSIPKSSRMDGAESPSEHCIKCLLPRVMFGVITLAEETIQ